jgi:DNA polymerase-3 subunit beta
MKIKFKQSDIAGKLASVVRAVPSRPTHPVLANILLCADAQSSKVTLTTFDLSLGIHSTFNADIEVGGAIALPAKLFTELISRLPNGEIVLESDEAIASLTTSSGHYEVRAMDAEEFPELPEIEGDAIRVSARTLLFGIKHSSFACSDEETKQLLTGVHLKISEDSLEFAATDGHRLAIAQIDEEIAIASPLEVNIPAKALRELERVLLNSEDVVEVKLNEEQSVFAWRGQKLVSRTLEGQFPNYSQLIPRQFERLATVHRRNIISVLERVSVLADQKNSIVKFSLNSSSQEIVLSCISSEVGNAQEAIASGISGSDLEIAFNCKYLLEGLKSFASAEVQMHLNGALSPVIFTPVGGDKITYLTMPIQIRE